MSAAQTTRKIVILAAIMLSVGFMIVADSRLPAGNIVRETIELSGVGMVLFCVVGRTWCTLYIGGHKNRRFVTYGPYSVTRNPLYLFTILGVAGVGAQLGSVVLMLTAGFIAWLIFNLVVLREEQNLLDIFGDTYRDYLARVPRFLPNPSLWNDVDTLEVQPYRLRATFIDATVFLVSIPITSSFEQLHDIGVLPTLIWLP